MILINFDTRVKARRSEEEEQGSTSQTQLNSGNAESPRASLPRCKEWSKVHL